MSRFSSNLSKLVLLSLVLVIYCLESATCNARHRRGRKQEPRQPSIQNSYIFNVLDYGAKGDGTTDDTKAFEATWIEACNDEGSTIMVPTDYGFLVGPIIFSGLHCEENIVFQFSVLGAEAILSNDFRPKSDPGPPPNCGLTPIKSRKNP
ncbi:hypothetical protein FXO38_23693 [Capsicum annuum]|nr:hypothetical protein FXO38_23693 [Capsicum annuum]KAF3656818.1 hypothetical protein FXO37_15279 [Capsicum annuum]